MGTTAVFQKQVRIQVPQQPKKERNLDFEAKRRAHYQGQFTRTRGNQILSQVTAVDQEERKNQLMELYKKQLEENN